MAEAGEVESRKRRLNRDVFCVFVIRLLLGLVPFFGKHIMSTWVFWMTFWPWC